MAGYKVTPPDLETCKSFDVYLKKLKVWENTTPAPVEKLGSIIASTLPNESKRWKTGLQDKFFEGVDSEKLVLQGGLQLVVKFLTKELGEEEIEKLVRVWDEFEDCKRGEATIDEFISDYDRAYNSVTCTSQSATIPSELRAFMLLKRSGATPSQRMMVLSRMNREDKPEMYNSMCRELKLILGGGPGSKNRAETREVKIEPSSVEDGVYFTTNGDRYVRDNFYRGRGRGGGRGRGAGGGFRSKPYDKPDNSLRENRKDESGKVTTCRTCNSTYHYQQDCEVLKGMTKGKSEERGKKEEAHFTEGVEEEELDFILETHLESELSQFTREAKNCAALDTCCTSSVAGKLWLEIFISQLSEEKRKKVKGPFPSKKIFKFGNSGKLKSMGTYVIPITLAGKSGSLELDLIDSDIPLLMSKKAMKAARMKINLDNDTVEVLGSEVDLLTTSSGHYCLPLTGVSEEDNFDWILSIDLTKLSEKDQFKSMVKLHKQFGHHTTETFIKLMKNAKSYYPGAERHLDKIRGDCEGCLIGGRNRDRPVVGMPMASEFNEKLAIDLKCLSLGGYILHIIDMWSRLTISILLDRKKPKGVINGLLLYWIKYFGVPRAILNDNGGEFTAEEVREVKAVLNIIDLTTGAESPWQNGLCEKNHQLVDTMFARMKEDFPDTDDEVLLAWADMAKNSMTMVYGFSPNQLVFGINPCLPNVLNEGLPALEGRTFSETLATHLDALHSARRAFTESESSERIRKALRKKICRNNTVYRNGDLVWYRKKDADRATGPGKVVFQDGKVIFVRHGATYVRLSANRIVRKGQEFAKSEETDDTVVKTRTAEPVVRVNTEEIPVIEADEFIDSDYRSNGEEFDDGTPAGVTSPPNEDIVEPNDDVPSNDSSILNEESSDTPNVSSEVDPVADIVTPRRGSTRQGKRRRSRTPSTSRSSKMGGGIKKRREDGTTEGTSSRNDAASVPEIQNKAKVIYPRSTKEKIKLRKDDWIEFDERGECISAAVLGREKVTGRHYNYFNVRGNDGIERNVDLERVKYRKVEEEEVNMVMIPQGRHKDTDCIEAKKVELKKLEEFKSYSVVDDEGQYRISCTWVLWYKGEDVRARLVARGFEEIEEVAADSPTVDKCNLRLALAIIASHGWTPETSDVKSAFLQGRQLDRLVTIKPPKEADVPKGKLWQLRVALYGLNDASLQFFLKCKEILLKLNCVQSLVDPAMFMKYGSREELIGVIVSHVDDFMHGGTPEFKTTVTNKLAEIFQMGKTEANKFKYVGYQIEQSDRGIKVDQNEFASEVPVINVKPGRAKDVDDELTDDEKSLLRKIAGKVGWLARGTRPDLVFAQIEMSTKFTNGKVKDLNQAAKVTRKIKDSESSLFISNLGSVENWSIEVSTDASLGNLNEGVSSTEAHLILIRDQEGNCAPIMWQANKIKRVVDSSLAAEALSLLAGLEEAIYLREIIEEIFKLKNKSVPVHAIVDNKGLTDALHSTTPVTNRRFRRDIGAIKQMMSQKEVLTVQWCPGSEQLADPMTKRGAPAWELMELFQSGRRRMNQRK